MEINSDASYLLRNAEQTLSQASRDILLQKEPLFRAVKDLIQAEHLNKLGVQIAREADDISRETLEMVQFDDRDRGRAFDIKV